MGNFKMLARSAAVAAAALGIGVLPATVSAQNGPTQGTLTVVVEVTGDPGGDPAAVSLLIERNTTTGGNETVVTAPGAPSQDFQLDPGSYVITASTGDTAYTITATSCDSQPGSGPNTADFIIDGPGDGGGDAASCVVEVSYVAPVVTEPPPETTEPPTETTEPPTDTTEPPTDTTEPPTEPPTDPGATTTTDQSALPPAVGPSETISATIPVTGATDETMAIVLVALGALLTGGGVLTIARRS